MTPGARAQAAIELLDMITTENPIEKCLTRWARSNRYAGSKDRVAVRDIVYDVLRQKRRYETLGGGISGRAMVAAYFIDQDVGLDEIFSGAGYAPAPLDEAELAALTVKAENLPDAVRYNYPDECEDSLKKSLGDDFGTVMEKFQERAPVYLRVNLAETTAEKLQAELASEGIECKVCDILPTGLEVITNPRRVAQSLAYKEGRVEIQDLSPQAAMASISYPENGTILDFCAGGGGKILASASHMNGRGQFFAYDIDKKRMRDLSIRAKRAEISVSVIEMIEELPDADLILVDVPCSGSGTWRRNPADKWRMSEEKMAELEVTQQDILENASKFVKQGGRIIYMTCSLFNRENRAQIDNFLESHKNWELVRDQLFTPKTYSDGFYLAELQEK